MTSREKWALNQLITINPNIQILVDKFGLDINTITEAQRRSTMISNRVEEIIQQIKASPLTQVERSVYREPDAPRLFWTSQELKEWITVTKFTL